MKLSHLLFCAPLVLAACSQQDADGPQAQALTDYVDLKIGSGGHGHVFVGGQRAVRNGTARAYKHPADMGLVASGYHDSDSTVIGFSHPPRRHRHRRPL